MAWKLAKGKTWNERLEQPHPNHGKLIALPPAARKRLGVSSLLIPKPLDVDALIRKVRKGKLVIVSRIRDRLAADAGADQSCPMTTGIFIRIAAEAAEEARRAGRKRITPYWRTIKQDGSLNEKYPGGAKAQAAKLRQEGFKFQQLGKGTKPPRVVDFEQHLVDL
ncbi:MAG: MGMT family protein [Planctomycetes bacterium]|nr:MGMT family protein [Planctomycetota bacterium]